LIASQALRCPNEIFLAAAQVCAASVTEEDLAVHRIYPALEKIYDISFRIAEAVAEFIFNAALTTVVCPRTSVPVLVECFTVAKAEGYQGADRVLSICACLSLLRACALQLPEALGTDAPQEMLGIYNKSHKIKGLFQQRLEKS
jgi:hypothetical protein